MFGLLLGQGVVSDENKSRGRRQQGTEREVHMHYTGQAWWTGVFNP